MVRAFWRWTAAAVLAGALLGCTRSMVQQKAPPPDPLLVTRKPIAGRPRADDADLSARLQPPAAPSSSADLASGPFRDAPSSVRPVQLRLEVAHDGDK